MPEQRTRQPEACNVVIFGASGDLTKRKLLPALARMDQWNLIGEGSRIIGVVRKDWSRQEWCDYVHEALAEYRPEALENGPTWERIEAMLDVVTGDLNEPATYQGLAEVLNSDHDRSNALFYLAVPPGWYETVAGHLSGAKLAAENGGFRRLVIEKPFGTDFESARHLNQCLQRYFDESQIYRIDHYLGKEGVQNLMVFRFANSVFEPLWNRNYIDHIQVSVSESLGVEYRAGYYESSGALRDMIQSHLMQVMTLVAMEPPLSPAADDVRNEKVKVLRAMRPISEGEVDQYALRAQYVSGHIDGDYVPAYRDEPNVAKDSVTETFAAVKLYVDNWRWQGVPFLLRTGKRLPERVSEIVIRFRKPPKNLFYGTAEEIAHNELVFRLHPDEGMVYILNAKLPGLEADVRTIALDAPYSMPGADTPDAYETLLHDVLLGEAALFSRADEVEESWRIVEPILNAWKQNKDIAFYAAGSASLPGIEALMADCEGCWRELSASHQHGHTHIS